MRTARTPHNPRKILLFFLFDLRPKHGNNKKLSHTKKDPKNFRFETNSMRFSCSTVAAVLVLASSSLFPTTEAFAGLKPITSFVPSSTSSLSTRPSRIPSSSLRSGFMSMSASGYTVAIVGATGAVGKEIRQCLEKSDFPTSKLRIFGSSRSAGSIMSSTKFGEIEVELLISTPPVNAMWSFGRQWRLCSRACGSNRGWRGWSRCH